MTLSCVNAESAVLTYTAPSNPREIRVYQYSPDRNWQNYQYRYKAQYRSQNDGELTYSIRELINKRSYRIYGTYEKRYGSDDYRPGYWLAERIIWYEHRNNELSTGTYGWYYPGSTSNNEGAAQNLQVYLKDITASEYGGLSNNPKYPIRNLSRRSRINGKNPRITGRALTTDQAQWELVIYEDDEIRTIWSGNN